MKESKPTYKYRDDGAIYSITYRDGYLNKHNENGPAYIEFNDRGLKTIEAYYINDMRHVVHGPSYIMYKRDGSKWIEVYHEEDKRHRLEGPAVIAYNEYGTVDYESFYLNGKLLDPLEFYCLVGKVKEDEHV